MYRRGALTVRGWYGQGLKLLMGAAYDRREWEMKLRERLLSDPDSDGPARQMHAVFTAAERRPALAKLTLPTLVVHGARDMVLPLANGVSTHMAIPGSLLMVLPNMGHGVCRLYLPAIVDAMVANCNKGVTPTLSMAVSVCGSSLAGSVASVDLAPAAAAAAATATAAVDSTPPPSPPLSPSAAVASVPLVAGGPRLSPRASVKRFSLSSLAAATTAEA